MSTACISEVRSFTSYHCETPNQLPNSLPSRTLDGPKMAPLVEQPKTNEIDALMEERPDEQYFSTETNSSGNNSDIRQDVEDSVNRLRDLPLSDSPPDSQGAHFSLMMHHIANFSRNQQPHLSFPTSAAPPFFSREEEVDTNGLYCCQKCEFVGRNDDELHSHSRTHDPYECFECGLLSDSRERVREHIKEGHKKIAASKREDYILYHGPESSPPRIRTIESFIEGYTKPRKTLCTVCKNFVGANKLEYYKHLHEEHSNLSLYRCQKCAFIATVKHHYEYHLSQHEGSRPFQCDKSKCSYSCINKSMLKSHLKSHSNVFQYPCLNCSYATKYLHSLKMHLRKLGHAAGEVLNPDGTVDKTARIDIYGKKRGPRGQKRKNEAGHSQDNGESPKSKSSPSPPSAGFLPIIPSTPPNLFNPHFHNNYAGNLCLKPGPSEAPNYLSHSPPSAKNTTCFICGIVESSTESYMRHVWSHCVNNHLNLNHFYQNPFASSPFQPSWHSGSFSSNIVNLPPTFERRNINEEQNVGAPLTWYPIKNRQYHEGQVNNGLSQTEYECFFPIGPARLANNPATKQLCIEAVAQPSRVLEKPCHLDLPFPNGIPTVKEEISEYVNGSGSPSTRNPVESGPLDLTKKQPTPPETKSRETGTRQGAVNRASSVSPKFGNEKSQVTVQKTNRRKGRAFKLNQYAMESEPLSDGAETGWEKMRVLFESTSPKPAVGKSVPRINFRKTLNATKGNRRPSQEPEQSNRKSLPCLQASGSCDPQTTGQRARDASDDCWCPHCDTCSASPLLQEYHSSYHSQDDPFTCAKCGLRCFEKDRFNAHIILGSRINGTCINSIEKC